QAEDGIRDRNVTGVQTCALPISRKASCLPLKIEGRRAIAVLSFWRLSRRRIPAFRAQNRSHSGLISYWFRVTFSSQSRSDCSHEIGRASCRERVEYMEATRALQT